MTQIQIEVLRQIMTANAQDLNMPGVRVIGSGAPSKEKVGFLASAQRVT